jgi:homoserine dehydrogenase
LLIIHSFKDSIAFNKQCIITMTPPLRIGMFGGGTVGGGVYEILMQRGCVSQRAMEIRKICVRSLDKPRDFAIDASQTTTTTDPASLLHDPDIDCIVEVMGGTGLARTVILEALQAGKSVVTANKALLASCLDELHQASLQSKTALCYEAAVCGGIPIINILQTCYTGDVIHQLSSIANGTTNYMLTKMEEGADYDSVLREAQELGYAEADPTADVEGHDVCAKLAIMTKLAFGQTVATDAIPTAGISKLRKVDFEYAKLLHCTIKLVGTARRLPGSTQALDGPLSVYASPMMLSTRNLLASARGSGNAIAITSANMGTCSYTGPGAGRFPTANSVVADIVRVANGSVGSMDPFPLRTSSELPIDNDYVAQFYVRIPYRDGLGIIRKTGEAAEQHGVSVHSILQNPVDDPNQADFCLTTEACKLSQVQAMCNALASAEFVRDTPLHMPLQL